MYIQTKKIYSLRHLSHMEFTGLEFLSVVVRVVRELSVNVKPQGMTAGFIRTILRLQ